MAGILLGGIILVVGAVWTVKALSGAFGRGMAGYSADADSWSTYTSTSGGYSVSIPGRVQEHRESFDSAEHPGLTMEDAASQLRDGTVFQVFVYSNAPRDWFPKYCRMTYSHHPDVRAERFFAGVIEGNEYRGKYLREDGVWRSVVARTFMVGDRLFDLSIDNDATVRINEEHAERFFSSFKLLDNAPVNGADATTSTSTQ